MAITQETLKVEGMSCNHCKMAVEKALKDLSGVSVVEVDLAGGSVAVTYDPASVNRDAIIRAIDHAGYRVVE